MGDIKCTCGRRTPFAHMHADDCPVQTPQFFGRVERQNAESVEAQLQQDYLLYGACYYTLNEQGGKIRIDPTKLIMRVRGIDAEMVERAKADAP